MLTERARLTGCAIGISVSVLCWSILLAALASTHHAIWSMIGRYKTVLLDLGQPPHAHCCLCGMTRAFRSICLGDISQAASYNAGSVFLFGIVIIGCALPFAYYTFIIIAKKTR